MDAERRVLNLQALERYRRFDSPLCLPLLSQVLSGFWSDCITTIGIVRDLEERPKKAAFFLVRRQQFLELLGLDGHQKAAEHVLRDKIYPLNVSKAAVEALVRELNEPRRAIEMEQWSSQRLGLFLRLIEVIPSLVNGPGSRSGATLEMLFTSGHHPLPLADLTLSEQEEIPSVCVQVKDTKTAISLVKFSNSGKYLASTSIDCTATIWMIHDNDNTIFLKCNLVGHRRPILSLEWKSDDTELITCDEEDVRLWNVDTGNCKKKSCMGMNAKLKACAWSHDPDKIFFGSCKPDSFICKLNLSTNVVEYIHLIPEVSDLVVTPSGDLICACSDNRIRELDFIEHESYEMVQKGAIAHVSLSKDGRLLIVNLNHEEIHVWNIWTHFVEHKYRIGKEDRIFGTCFGGNNCSFIAAGSQESEIYIWHQKHKFPIKILSGHKMSVNSVSWNLAKPHMLVSGSSDGTICVWVTRSKCKDPSSASRKRKA